MKTKINEVAESIKSKLLFEDYKPSLCKDVNTETQCHNAIKKVKRTFYILESVANELDALYLKKFVENDKVDKSDIVTQGLINLFKDQSEIKKF